MVEWVTGSGGVSWEYELRVSLKCFQTSRGIMAWRWPGEACWITLCKQKQPTFIARSLTRGVDPFYKTFVPTCATWPFPSLELKQSHSLYQSTMSLPVLHPAWLMHGLCFPDAAGPLQHAWLYTVLCNVWSVSVTPVCGASHLCGIDRIGHRDDWRWHSRGRLRRRTQVNGSGEADCSDDNGMDKEHGLKPLQEATRRK